MPELCWRIFVDIKVSEYYYFSYVQHSRHCLLVVNIVGLIISCSGIFTWINEYFNAFISSLVILVGQLVSVLQPFYPYSERLYAARHIHLALSKISLDAEQTLNSLIYGKTNEDDAFSRLQQLQKDAATVDEKFASSDTFPHKKHLHKSAEHNAQQYVNVHFNLGDEA